MPIKGLLHLHAFCHLTGTQWIFRAWLPFIKLYCIFPSLSYLPFSLSCWFVFANLIIFARICQDPLSLGIIFKSWHCINYFQVLKSKPVLNKWTCSILISAVSSLNPFRCLGWHLVLIFSSYTFCLFAPSLLNR